MTPEQTALVQDSFKSVQPETAAARFYARLFELDPALRPLFGRDIMHQGAKLMAALSVAVAGLGNVETIAPTLRDLGARHAGYGVKSAHYDVVGQALIWTLEQCLGPRFTAEVRQAWSDAYQLLSSTMNQAADRVA